MQRKYPTIESWLQAIDAILLDRIGLTHMDLPDCCYADWYEDGVTPKGAASKAIKNAGE